MELAKHHLKYGLQDEALSLLENMDSSEINPEEKDKLLKEIYQKQGNQEELFSVLKRKFFRTPAVEIFEEIVNTVGDERRNELLKEFTEELLNSKHDVVTKLLFLISTEQVSIAANIIRKDYMNIDGGYTRLLSGLPVLSRTPIHWKPHWYFADLYLEILNQPTLNTTLTG